MLGHALVAGVDAVLGKVFGTELGEVGEDIVAAAGELTTSALVGGVHNAGHETLFNAMQGNGWGWSWGTFSGGAAQGVTGLVARGLAAGHQLLTMNAALPAEEMLIRVFGGVNPDILNEIATGGGKFGGDDEGPPGDVGEFEFDENVSEDAPLLEGAVPFGGAVSGEGELPSPVEVLRAAGIEPGPETAFQIALRTGFVPTVGEATEHPLYATPVTGTIQMAGFVMAGKPDLSGAVTVQPENAGTVQPAGVTALPAGRVLAEEPAVQPGAQPIAGEPVAVKPVPSERVEPGPSGSLLDGPPPASASQFPVLAPDVSASERVEPGPSGSLLDGPPPASASQFPVLAPDVSASEHVQPGSVAPAVTEPVAQAAGQQQPVTGDLVAGPPVSEQVPQAGSAPPDQQVPGQETVQPGLSLSQVHAQDAAARRASSGMPPRLRPPRSQRARQGPWAITPSLGGGARRAREWAEVA